MKIKDIELPHGLMLCPMAGVTDRAFRLICARYGAEYTVTEMVSAKALVYEQRGRDGTPYARLRFAPLTKAFLRRSRFSAVSRILCARRRGSYLPVSTAAFLGGSRQRSI